MLYWVFILSLLSFFVMANLQGFLTVLNVNVDQINNELVQYIASPLQFLETILFGILIGVTFIIANEVADKLRVDRYSFGRIIYIKTLMYLGGFILSFFIVFAIVSQLNIFPIETFKVVLFSGKWVTFFIFSLVFIVIQIIFINFFIETVKKFGHSNLASFVTGKYYYPVIENRIFLFMDLQASTTHAEKLGSIRYSQLIKDCFADINNVIERKGGEIYQYVGDEVVITWHFKDGVENIKCIDLFFQCEHFIQARSEHYMKKYGLVPTFKAGLHGGTVTATEIGSIKRDIAYYGDVLNTASRLQSLCNTYNESLLVSGYMLEQLNIENKFDKTYLGDIPLKGKKEKVRIFAIKEKSF